MGSLGTVLKIRGSATWSSGSKRLLRLWAMEVTEVGHDLAAGFLGGAAVAVTGGVELLEERLGGGEIEEALGAALEVNQPGVGGEDERLEFNGRVAQNEFVARDLVKVGEADFDEVMNVSFVKRHRDSRAPLRVRPRDLWKNDFRPCREYSVVGEDVQPRGVRIGVTGENCL